jgi:hypothetical protein
VPTFLGPVDDNGNITVPAEGGATIPIKEQTTATIPVQIDISAVPMRFFVKGRIDKVVPVDPGDALGKLLTITELEGKNLSFAWHSFQLLDETDSNTPVVIWSGKIRRSEIVDSVQAADSGDILISYGLSTIVIQRNGIPGLAGDQAAVFEFDQVSPSATWTVNHNLNGKPSSVMVLNSGGREIEADLLHTSNSQFILYFTTPQSGIVRVSP